MVLVIFPQLHIPYIRTTTTGGGAMHRKIISTALTICILLGICSFPQSAHAAGEPSVSAGRYHTLYLAPDATLYAWGDNRYGQLGDGTSTIRAYPTEIMKNVVFIAAGLWASYAITADGSLYAWGNNEQGQLGTGDLVSWNRPKKILDGVLSVHTALNRAYAILENGDVLAWGNSQYIYPIIDERLSPTPRVIASTADNIFCGGSHTLILRGNVLSGWGGTIAGSVREQKITEIQLTARAISAAADSLRILYVDVSGNLYRIIGISSVKMLEGVTSVCSGTAHFAAVTVAGDLYMMGNNDEGQLGTGGYDYQNFTAVARNVAACAAGDGFTVALKTNGELWAWGSNTYGQLGTGTNRLSYNFPHMVSEGSFEYPAKNGGYSVVFDGRLMNFDVQPLNRDGRVLVPMRAIFEAFGATVDWNAQTRIVTATLSGRTIRLSIGSAIAYVNGAAVLLDAPAEIVNGRTLVPVRFISEALSADVSYIASERIVEIARRNTGFEVTSEVREKLRTYNVVVDVSLNDGSSGRATGVVVHSGGLVLTNRHVVENSKSIRLTFSNGKVAAGEVCYIDKDRDFALIITNAALPTAPWHGIFANLLVGDIAVLCGNPGNATGSVFAGKVESFDYMNEKSFITNIAATPGLSGSGIYNRNLELVGLMWSSVGSGSAVIPIRYITEHIAAMAEKYGLG